MSLPPDIDLHMKIFHPIARSEYYRFECSKRPFVYYTRAPTAVSIINKGEFWMREVSRMNDYREVQHGLECIEAAFKSAEGARTLEIFESTHPRRSNGSTEHPPVQPSESPKGHLHCLHIGTRRSDRRGRLSWSFVDVARIWIDDRRSVDT